MTTGAGIAIAGIGLAGLYFISRSSAKTQQLTPAQAAQLQAARSAAALQAQQNNSLTKLLSSLLGKGSAQSQSAPKPSPSSAGTGSSQGQRSEGTGPSAPAQTNLGHPCPCCPASWPPGAVSYDPSTGQFFDANGNDIQAGAGSIAFGVVCNGDGTMTVCGQLYCASTGQPITAGPEIPPDIGSVCDTAGLNNDGGTGQPDGGITPFVGSACEGGCSAICFC